MASFEFLAIILTGLGLSVSITYYAMNLKNQNETQQQSLENRKAHKAAFREVFGRMAVVSSDDAATQEARYRGAEVVDRSSLGSTKSVAEDLVGTDTQYVQEIEGQSETSIPDNKLDQLPLKNLRMVRRLAKRAGFTGKIMAYFMSDGVRASVRNGNIRIAMQVLGDDHQSIASLIHELAHIEHSTKDATAEHVAAVSDVAAKLIATYASRR